MIVYQHKEGYRYNSDSIFLYNFIVKYKIKGSLLDIGSGCGILGLLVKRDFCDIELSQIDIQGKNVELNQKNVKENNIFSRIICDDFITHNFEEKFDFIISNPPFYHSGSLKSENKSLYLSRHSDSLKFDEFVKKSYMILNHKGSIIFCYDAKQIDMVTAKLMSAKFKINELQFVHVNKNKEASLVLIYARRDSKNLCKILPPLILYENKELRDDIKKIFIKADTNSENI